MCIFSHQGLDCKSKKNCECLAVCQHGRFKLPCFTSFNLISTAGMPQWKGSVQKRVLVLVTTVSPNCTSSGNCLNLTPLFLFCIGEKRRLPSVLPASLACCWVEWGIIYRTSLTSRMCFTNVRWHVYVISFLMYSLLLGLSGLDLSLWT